MKSMDTNPYAPPSSDVEVPVASKAVYYVVSIRKFTLLFFATLGAYVIYWFYRNWRAYREFSGEKIWPVARGIFSIFFAHSLFEKVNARLAERNIAFKWSPRSFATWYVVVAVLSNVLDRASSKGLGSPVTDVLGILVLPAMYYTLLVPQRAVNAAEGDPLGQGNANLSGANIAWIVLGALMWIAVAVGLVAVLGGLPEDL
jgi:hypothetical protein